MPSRGHRLALGATAVVTVGLASAFASAIGAQTPSDPIATEIVSVDAAGLPQDLPDSPVAAMSDTGGVVVYETAPAATVNADADAGPADADGADPADTDDADDDADAGPADADPADADADADPADADPADADPDAAEAAGDVRLDSRRVWIRDRIANTGRAVAEVGSVAPAVSGNGCIVAYTVLTGADAKLTTVDRCATDIDVPLPIGTVVDTIQLDPIQLDTSVSDITQVAPPSLSFDGSTIVWSTGREIRRYAHEAPGGPYVRSHTFDVVTDGSPDVVTGIETDISADGRSVVFVAGPGTSPFEPLPANVYLWTPATPQLDPELISATASLEPGQSDSMSPEISADGSFVVFESTDPDLAVVGSSPVTVPFVVGVDRVERTGKVLVDDADRPAVSADGNHVVYRRGDAVRVLSSDAAATVDHGIEELAQARPSGPVAISQHGRWLVFAGTTETFDALTDVPVGSPAPASATAAVLAVDRSSSNSDVVDTTTAPAPTTSVAPTTAPVSSTPPTSEPTATDPEVIAESTVPATTLLPTVIVPRFPTVDSRFPTVRLPQTPRRVFPSAPGSSFDPSFDSTDDLGPTALASPVSFDPTVAGIGRRSEPVVLTNAGSLAFEVAAVSIDIPAAFVVVTDNCSGSSIAPGSTCAVDVQFAPITVGPVSANLTFRLTDGSLASATLDGEGVPEPTLDLVPAVAGAGQTVTGFGVGFPPGSTVELARPGSSTPESIVVDADGTFAHVVVVLPNTPVGSASLSVRGQPDAFSDVAAELLVSSRGAASADAALRGGPGGLLGR